MKDEESVVHMLELLEDDAHHFIPALAVNRVRALAVNQGLRIGVCEKVNGLRS